MRRSARFTFHEKFLRFSRNISVISDLFRARGVGPRDCTLNYFKIGISTKSPHIIYRKSNTDHFLAAIQAFVIGPYASFYGQGSLNDSALSEGAVCHAGAAIRFSSVHFTSVAAGIDSSSSTSFEAGRRAEVGPGARSGHWGVTTLMVEKQGEPANLQNGNPMSRTGTETQSERRAKRGVDRQASSARGSLNQWRNLGPSTVNMKSLGSTVIGPGGEGSEIRLLNLEGCRRRWIVACSIEQTDTGQWTQADSPRPLFTPVYGCWRDSPGVPKSLTAWDAIRGDLPRHMSLENRQIGPRFLCEKDIQGFMRLPIGSLTMSLTMMFTSGSTNLEIRAGFAIGDRRDGTEGPVRDMRSVSTRSNLFIINEEFEQNQISFGQVRFGRAIGPFRRRQIGKNRKPSHIINWVSVVTRLLLNLVCLRPVWQSMAFVFCDEQRATDN